MEISANLYEAIKNKKLEDAKRKLDLIEAAKGKDREHHLMLGSKVAGETDLSALIDLIKDFDAKDIKDIHDNKETQDIKDIKNKKEWLDIKERLFQILIQDSNLKNRFLSIDATSLSLAVKSGNYSLVADLLLRLQFSPLQQNKKGFATVWDAARVPFAKNAGEILLLLLQRVEPAEDRKKFAGLVLRDFCESSVNNNNEMGYIRLLLSHSLFKDNIDLQSTSKEHPASALVLLKRLSEDKSFKEKEEIKRLYHVQIDRAIEKADKAFIMQALKDDAIDLKVYREKLYLLFIQPSGWLDAMKILVEKDKKQLPETVSKLNLIQKILNLPYNAYYESDYRYLKERQAMIQLLAEKGANVNEVYDQRVNWDWFVEQGLSGANGKREIQNGTPLMHADISLDNADYFYTFVQLKGKTNLNHEVQILMNGEKLSVNILDLALLRERYYTILPTEEAKKNYGTSYRQYRIMEDCSRRVDALVKEGIVPKQFEKHYTQYSVQSLYAILDKHNYDLSKFVTDPKKEKDILENFLERYVNRKIKDDKNPRAEEPVRLQLESYKKIFDKLGAKYFINPSSEFKKKFINEMIERYLLQVKMLAPMQTNDWSSGVLQIKEEDWQTREPKERQQVVLRSQIADLIKLYPSLISEFYKQVPDVNLQNTRRDWLGSVVGVYVDRV